MAGLAALFLGAIAALPAANAATDVPDYAETPFFAEAIAEGRLPTVERRLPKHPLVAVFDRPDQTVGRHGGTLRMLMARPKDVRLMVVYGYARLMKYDRRLNLVTDILERVEVENGRVFTLKLRPGHKWSDGAPFTAEDFRYYWEDVANNPELSPAGPPDLFLVDGEPPRFEVIDETTVRYTWRKPNPAFLPALARARPPFIYRPAHYLKRFHARYADRAALDARARKMGLRSWAGLHNRLDNPYKFDNPDLPTLQPWINTTRLPADRLVLVRNPYYHKVDPAGRQLPYIDRVVVTIADRKIIPAKTGAGETDLQARYLRFDNYAFLKRNAERSGYRVFLWRIGKGAHLALYPNLNAADSGWRELMRDVRFRRALSLAIDRREINRILYYGLGIEGQNTVLPLSPLYRDGYRTAWAQHDPGLANRLLDEIGLTQRDKRGIRLMPDGRPIEIVVDSAGESTEETDVLQLIRDRWREIGILLHIRTTQREVFRNRIFAGDAVMAISSGLENGLATADNSPAELAPTRQIQYQWPKWGQYAETGGRVGEVPDLKEAVRLARLLERWKRAPTREARAEIWHRMLAIHADQVFTIGLISGTFQPIVVSRRLRNVPEEGIYNWNPGAHFGLYQPDTFWFAPAR